MALSRTISGAHSSNNKLLVGSVKSNVSVFISVDVSP